MKRRPKKEPIDLQAGWTVGWHRRQFKRLEKQPEFQAVVTLSRIVNMLRFVHSIVLRAKGPGPEARRQRAGAFFLSGAVLVETERTLEAVGKCFRDAEDFLTMAHAVHSERFEAVVSRFRTARKQAVFHFDLAAFGPALERIAKRDQAYFPFLTAFGTVNKDGYYDLADEVALLLVLGDDVPLDAQMEWMTLSARVTNEVFRAIDTFIAGRLHSWGYDAKPTEHDVPEDIEETRRIVRERKAKPDNPS